MQRGLKLLLIVVYLFCTSAGVFSQNISIHSPRLQFLIEDSLNQSLYFHSAIKPLEVPINMLNKSFGDTNSYPVKRIFLSPLVELTDMYNLNENSVYYRFGQGFYSSGSFKGKAGYEFSGMFIEQSFAGTTKYSLDSLHLVPGYYKYIYSNGKHAGYLMFNGYVYWKPLKWLTLKAGNDKHFIGDGYRSLFLSENAASYPFLQLRLRVWKIDYMFQNLWLRDLIPGFYGKRFAKYAAMHTLSYNLTKRLNFYIFETVIWRKQDSIRHRGFDLQYLNPFLFFRPAEYNMGSPDNVLLGIGSKLQVFKGSYIYGQLLLDEFRLQELKANKGWWGNKYAFQAGFKIYRLFRSRASLLQLEYNQARPFTWSHSYTLQNYGYLNMPLAHPLGANFREFTGIFRVYLGKKWMLHARSIIARYGTDLPGTNYGSDIYKQQWSYTKFNGNYTTQGVRNDLLMYDLSLSRILIPSWRLHAEITFGNSVHSVSGVKEYQPSVEFGIQTLLYD
jgi:hypothetical protein